jgi:histidine triad (HIT) family protein
MPLPPLSTLSTVRPDPARRVAMAPESCVFCRIVAGVEPARIVARWPEAIAIVPLNPVVDGHRLVIPHAHVADAFDDPWVTGMVAARAAEFAAAHEVDCNLITSVGRAATQTVYHLHWHVVPRSEGDGLALPWTGQVVSDVDPA